MKTLSAAEKLDFAARCGTTLAYIRKFLCQGKRMGATLAIAVERESGGKVRVDTLAPDADWHYIRGTSRQTEATQ